MLIEYESLECWLDRAVSGIRFKPDRLAVRAELYAHLEDRTLDLLRIFPDMDPDEARDRALSTMGDAEELKKKLGKIHRPWLGWLWQFSRGLMWGALAVLLAVCILNNDHYHSAGFPLWMDWTARFAAPAEVSPEKARVGDFTFQIVEAVWLEDREEYLLTLRVFSPRFWERLNVGALHNGLTAVTPDGARCPMQRVYSEQIFGTVHLARWGLFHQEYGIYIPAAEWTSGDWVTLEMAARQGGFALSAMVTEEVAEP